MSIKSMTGFARAEGAHAGVTWHWEVRSVNGRGLDLRLRLPPGNEALEPRVREAVGRHVTRGSVSIALAVERHDSGVEIHLNERALAQVMHAADRVRDLTNATPPRVDGLIGIKGVLDIVEPQEDPEQAAARSEAMLKSLEGALVALIAARAAEGARLAATLAAQLDEIERLVLVVKAAPGRSREAIEQRLKEQVRRLMESANGFDPTRLHQEAVLLATRADVEEELQRLASHIDAARELIGDSGAVGRKLDFLAQEFNREANTLCSKANAVDLTAIGLDLKAVIDQLREQVQNVE